MPQFLDLVYAQSTADTTGPGSGSVQVAGGAYVAKSLYVAGTMPSTSSTTGALVVPNGGLGVGGDAYVGGGVYATKFVVTGGTASQFLKADGTVDTTAYISLASPITGYVAGSNTALASTDTLVSALGKLQAQINAVAGGTVSYATVTAALGYTPVNKAGDVMTGSLTTVGLTISNAGRADISMINTSGAEDQKRWDWSVDGFSGAGTLTLLTRSDAGTGSPVLAFTRSGATITYTVLSSSATVVGNLLVTSLANGTGTDARCLRAKNAGSDTYFGVEGSTAGGFFTGSAAYDAVVYTTTPFNLIVGGTSKLRVTSSLAIMATPLQLNSSLVTTMTTASGINCIRIRDVVSYTKDTSGVTGTIKIKLPVGWTNTMMSITINGFDYNGTDSNWQVVVSGYNYAGGPSWTNTSAKLVGAAPFTSIRLGYDGTNCCILLGTTATVWQYPKIIVSDVILGYSNYAATTWYTGWDVSLLTSESGITVTATPPITNATTVTLVNGLYTGSGGLQPPSYIPSGQVRFNMMNGPHGSLVSGYCDYLLMDTYTGTDVPYVTGLGLLKAAGNPRGFLIQGGKAGTAWNTVAEIITSANISSQSVNYASTVGSITGTQVFNAINGSNNTDWYRTTGSCGIFFSSYSTGLWATSTQWLETYNYGNLRVNGELRATGNITAYYSDQRLKENIKLIEGALDKVLALRGVTFNANQKALEVGYTDTSEQVGVIAQEVQKVLPQAVKFAPFDQELSEDGTTFTSKSGENYLTVQYERLAPLLIEAIKELNAKIEAKR